MHCIGQLNTIYVHSDIYSSNQFRNVNIIRLFYLKFQMVKQLLANQPDIVLGKE